jgi:murein L,D-transpeptidase YafK
MNQRRALLALLLAGTMVSAHAQTIDLVRVLKAERKIQLLSAAVVQKEFKVALGGSPVGHKQREGDQKTPEGTYVLDYKKSDSAFYKAIHISYPNAQDIAHANKQGVSLGGQIMIHGQKNGLGWLSSVSQNFDWTNGCVALSNADMEEVWKSVKPGTQIELRP